MPTGSSRTLLIFAACVCLTGSPGVRKMNRMDRAWKGYRNTRFGYCIAYPSRWVREDAFDGAGFWVEAGEKSGWPPLGEMDVRVLGRSGDPVQFLTLHLENLKRFERAQQLEVIRRGRGSVRGAPALFAAERYRDQLDGSEWVDELVLTSLGATLYLLELECRADQLSRFEPIFERFSDSFRFECEKK
jgi:hypothetical protein